MNYKLSLLLLMLFIASAVHAQDVIIKQNNDSIPCVIEEIGVLFLKYRYNDEGKVVRTTIPLKDVKTYQFTVLPADPILNKRNAGKKGGKALTLSASYGLGYMIAPIDQTMQKFVKDYLNELRSGTSFHGEAAFYFTKFFGMGVHYSRFYTQNRIDKVIYFRPQDTVIRPLEDIITVNIIGPAANFRFGSSDSRFNFSASAGIGYAHYKNKAQYGEPLLITGESAAIFLTGNLLYNFTDEFALFGKIGLINLAYIEQNVKRENGQIITVDLEDSPDNNSRVDLHVGIRYTIGKK